MSDDFQPLVSVVIPCYNANAVLGTQLAAIQRQAIDVDYEVIVADNGSSDGSADTAGKYSSALPPVVVCDAGDKRGINHARNSGVRSSRGRYILLCDADDRVTNGWIAAMIRAFEGGATLVGGRIVRVATDETRIGVPDDGLRNDLNYLPWPRGANCGFTRAIYDELGGFNENYKGGGDETDFFWRAQLLGHRLEYVEQAGVLYTERPAAKPRFKQNYWYGRSHVQLYKAFAASGMPRASAKGAVWFWLTIPWRLMLAVSTSSRKRIVVAHLGQRIGRIGGSIVFRTAYP